MSDKTTIARVPVIDLGPCWGTDPEARLQLAKAIGRACTEIGFFSVVGHRIASPLLNAMEVAARQFFDLPQAEKNRARAAALGYMPLETERLAASADDEKPGDIKETLDLRFPVDPASWPAQAAHLVPLCRRYFEEMLSLSGSMLRLFALALDVPENFFDDKVNRPVPTLRLANYPPVRQVKPGQMGAGEHTDYGTLTLLWSPDPSGLQVRTRSGNWLDVHVEPDSFIVNIGDLMMYWTNDRWISTLHRVTPRLNVPRRQSVVFFHNPNPDALIACLPSCCDERYPAKYAPILAREHLKMKFDKSLAPTTD